MSSQSGNHFELFGLEPSFSIDAKALDAAYRALQSRVHPDRFAAADDKQKRLALQWATRANEAYQVLKNPLERAVYLLRLRGVDARAELNTRMAPDFLMQQMEWRERAEDAAAARNAASLEALLRELEDAQRLRRDKASAWLDSGADVAANDAVREWLFLDRVSREVGAQLERLETS